MLDVRDRAELGDNNNMFRNLKKFPVIPPWTRTFFEHSITRPIL
jgi:hypothetical protein